MISQLLQIIMNFGNPAILLVGDFMLDCYLYGLVLRVSPEAPVPVLKVNSCEARPGGAGSVAVDLSQLGAQVKCIGVVGDDENADILMNKLTESQIDIGGLLKINNRPTTSKQRIIGSAQQHNQQLIRIDYELTVPLNHKENNFLIQTFKEKLTDCRIVCLQDHDKSVLSDEVCKHIIDCTRKASKQVLVDPASGVNWRKYNGANLIKPNRREISKVVDFHINSMEDAEKATRIVQEKYNIETVLITLDRDGAYLKESDLPGQHYLAKAKEVYDITGAGDMVLATLAICLAEGCSCRNAVKISNIAAGIEIEKIGAAPISKDELINALTNMEKSTTDKICDIKTLESKLILHRKRNEKIVFTNGCFDVVHKGHIELLKFCKLQGKVVIVGLNSDNSVRAIKGPCRPINNQYDRSSILAALETVDYVIVFEELDPINLIKKVKPDVLVKGKDWELNGVVGQDIVESYGGKVLLAPLVEGKSSSSIIEKIRSLNYPPS
jgi:D-beta-D-heptose 7-phosphate kinase/D-beta-D-heptose 1-phosphate adenosyltransferase